MDASSILEHRGMVYKIAQKFYGVEMEDLLQAGFLGLIKASKNYDSSKCAKFSTYAYQYIYGEMYEVATGERPIKLRKDSMNLYKNVIRTKELLTQKFGREVSYEEVARFLNIDINLLNDILNSLCTSVSIENTELNISTKDKLDDMLLLKECMSQLSSLEQSVIKSRYFEDQSQDETAKTLGLSQVKVSRIEKRSREKMKNFIAS